MNIEIKFKKLIIIGNTSIDEVCKKIEKRNPDMKIDEAVWVHKS